MRAYFSNIIKPKAPIVTATLYNPLLSKKATVDFMVDTGFAGGVLISLDIYTELDLHLFETVKKMGRVVTGMTFELRASRAILEFNGVKIPCMAYTSLGVSRNLLGREVLEKLKMTYIPKQNVLNLDFDP